MCVVERKTYIHSASRRDVVETARRCHRASNDGLCDYVEYKDISPVRVMELRPSSTSGHPSSSRDVVTTARSGRERRYREVTGRTDNRSSTGRTSRPSSSQYPMDSPTLPLSPMEPTCRETREVRPPAPSPPLVEARLGRASGPRVSFSEPLDNNRTELSDGTAVYQVRESMLGRGPMERSSSISSLANEINEYPLPQRRPSIMKRRTQPAGIDLSQGGLSNTTSASSSPGLSNLPRVGVFPQDSAADLPSSGSHQRYRRPHVDSSLDDSYGDHIQQDAERDTQTSRDQLARSQRRRSSRGADDSPRLLRNSIKDHRRRHRHESEAAVDGAQSAEVDAHQPDCRVADELAQREREGRERRAREGGYLQTQGVSPSPTLSRSSRNSYTSSYAYTTSPVLPTRQLPLARQVADTSTPMTARAPRSYSVQVHNYPADSLAERGEQVIARERLRAVEAGSQRMADRMERMGLEDDEIDEHINSSIFRPRSRREKDERSRRRGHNSWEG